MTHSIAQDERALSAAGHGPTRLNYREGAAARRLIRDLPACERPLNRLYQAGAKGVSCGLQGPPFTLIISKARGNYKWENQGAKKLFHHPACPGAWGGVAGSASYAHVVRVEALYEGLPAGGDAERFDTRDIGGGER